jgi:hypothetical protein
MATANNSIPVDVQQMLKIFTCLSRSFEDSGSICKWFFTKEFASPGPMFMD